MGSEMCIRDRIDPGYADGADLSYQDYNQAGAFYSFLSCEPEASQENLERMGEVYREIMADGPTDEELEQAKNKVLARSVLRSERPMGRLGSIGFNWMYRRRYISIDEELNSFSRVTLDDVRRVLKDWPLWPMTTISVGPSTAVEQPA